MHDIFCNYFVNTYFESFCKSDSPLDHVLPLKILDKSQNGLFHQQQHNKGQFWSLIIFVIDFHHCLDLFDFHFVCTRCESLLRKQECTLKSWARLCESRLTLSRISINFSFHIFNFLSIGSFAYFCFSKLTSFNVKFCWTSALKNTIEYRNIPLGQLLIWD